MSFHQQLDELKTSVKQDLTAGASVQSVVERHFEEIQRLLRGGNKVSGPFTVRQLSEGFEVGYFALRTALRRADKKLFRNNQTQKQEQTTTNKLIQSSSHFAKQKHIVVTETLKLMASQIDLKERKIIESRQVFLLEFDDQGIYKMVFHEEKNGLLIFDAYAKAGQSKISKRIKFNLDMGNFEKV